MEIGEGFEEAHTTIIYTPTLFINAIGDQKTNPEWGLTLIAGGFNPRKADDPRQGAPGKTFRSTRYWAPTVPTL